MYFRKILTGLFIGAGLFLNVENNAFAQTVPTSPLETYATFDKTTPPGNLAITPDGRIFMSVHEFYGYPQKIVEVLKDGTTRPYPTTEWAVAREEGVTHKGLNGVLGLNADENGILWMLDAQTAHSAGRLVAWDTKNEKLHRVIYLGAPVTKKSSFLNDLAIDTKNNAIYISDTAGGATSAIIVVDLITGQARRVLEGSAFTVAEKIDMIIDDKHVKLGGNPAYIGVNPITIDHEFDYVYFAPMTGHSLYRIKSEDLRNWDLSDAELNKRVERYGDKPISDGITVDMAGNVYITSITDNEIGITMANGKYRTLYQDKTISWPDGFAVGADGYIYVTVNELHKSPPLNGGKNGATGLFKIMRFKTLGKALPGR